MIYKFVIQGRFAGLNEYTSANRTNIYKGAKMKRDAQNVACACIYAQLRSLRIKKPVKITYIFTEKDRRRDLDNVESFAKKVINDALVECKILADDGWNEIRETKSIFKVDKKNPNIEIIIEEVE